MARLPDPEMEEVKVCNSDDVVERRNSFYSILKHAVGKAEMAEKKNEKGKEVK